MILWGTLIRNMSVGSRPTNCGSFHETLVPGRGDVAVTSRLAICLRWSKFTSGEQSITWCSATMWENSAAFWRQASSRVRLLASFQRDSTPEYRSRRNSPSAKCICTRVARSRQPCSVCLPHNVKECGLSGTDTHTHADTYTSTRTYLHVYTVHTYTYV